MGSVRKITTSETLSREDLLGAATEEDQKRAVNLWASAGIIECHRVPRRLFNDRMEAFMSGLGIGAIIGAVGMLLLILWLTTKW